MMLGGVWGYLETLCQSEPENLVLWYRGAWEPPGRAIPCGAGVYAVPLLMLST